MIYLGIYLGIFDAFKGYLRFKKDLREQSSSHTQIEPINEISNLLKGDYWFGRESIYCFKD